MYSIFGSINYLSASSLFSLSDLHVVNKPIPNKIIPINGVNIPTKHTISLQIGMSPTKAL